MAASPRICLGRSPGSWALRGGRSALIPVSDSTNGLGSFQPAYPFVSRHLDSQHPRPRSSSRCKWSLPGRAMRKHGAAPTEQDPWRSQEAV